MVTSLTLYYDQNRLVTNLMTHISKFIIFFQTPEIIFCQDRVMASVKSFDLYSPDKSRADISLRLFHGYWATSYLQVAYCYFATSMALVCH